MKGITHMKDLPEFVIAGTAPKAVLYRGTLMVSGLSNIDIALAQHMRLFLLGAQRMKGISQAFSRSSSI